MTIDIQTCNTDFLVQNLPRSTTIVSVNELLQWNAHIEFVWIWIVPLSLEFSYRFRPQCKIFLKIHQLMNERWHQIQQQHTRSIYRLCLFYNHAVVGMFTKSPISSSSSGLALAVSDLALLGGGGWLASFSAFSLAFFSALSLLFCSLQWSLWVLGAHHVVLKCVYERPSDSFCVFLYIGFRIHK